MDEKIRDAAILLYASDLVRDGKFDDIMEALSFSIDTFNDYQKNLVLCANYTYKVTMGDTQQWVTPTTGWPQQTIWSTAVGTTSYPNYIGTNIPTPSWGSISSGYSHPINSTVTWN